MVDKSVVSVVKLTIQASQTRYLVGDFFVADPMANASILSYCSHEGLTCERLLFPGTTTSIIS